MFEITYKENALPSALIQRDEAVYDFTVEGHYHIYHRPRKDTVEYISYDARTNRGSRIFEKKVPLLSEEHILIVPDILKSIRYTGDRRSEGGYLAPAPAPQGPGAAVPGASGPGQPGQRH